MLAVLSATFAVAAPTAGGDHHKPHYTPEKYQKDCDKDWEHKWENDDWKKDENLFYFDAEYYVKATPDQVIATSGAPTPGQPGAKGIFKYGINVAENTICYVSQSFAVSELATNSIRTSPFLVLPAGTSHLPSQLRTFTRLRRASQDLLVLLSLTPRDLTTAVFLTAA